MPGTARIARAGYTNPAWPYQTPSYPSALPGVAGPGLDFGTDQPSKIYFITSLLDTSVGGADASYGSNCFSGTARYCWQADQGSGYHKYIVPLVSGYVYIGRKVNSPSNLLGRGDMDYIGHAAPGPGLFWRCAVPRVAGGSNVRIWHMASWMGDEDAASGVTVDAGQRDGLQASYPGFTATDVAFINCEARFSMDEGVECFYAMDGVSWIRGAIYDPLHIPPDFGDITIPNHHPGEDHGYGHLIGGSDLVNNSLVMQSLYAHTTDRNPLVAATNHAHVNNLHYNHGRDGGGNGAALHVSDNGGFNAANSLTMQMNMVGNVGVKGPENTSTMVFAAHSGTLPASSSAHSKYNGQFGWSAPANQDAFFTSTPFGGYMQSTLRSSAWYDGLGSSYEGVLQPFANPLSPTTGEGLRFTDLVRRTVGMKPRHRLYTGGVNTVINQIENRIRSGSDTFQFINEVTDIGDWPSMPQMTVDPASPGSHYHAAMPLDSTRDDILVAGTFANGASKVGYTKLRAWCIDQYFYVMT